MVLGVYVLALAVSPLARLITGGIAGGDRNRQLDGMRALAAVGVVACHINQYMMAFIGYSAPPLWGNHVGILGVQLFFALTAFLFTSKALDGRFHPRQFCIDRMRRILPLYFAVCIAAFGIASYYSWHQSYPVDRMILDAIDVLSHGFWQKDAIQFRDINMLTLVGIAWTLSYEWAFYLLLIPAFYLWRTGRTAKFAVVSLITILAVRDFYLHPEQVIWPFFLPGIAAAFMRNRVPRPAASALNLMAIPAVFLVLWLPTFWTPIKLLLVSLIFFAVLFGRPAWLTWAPLQTLGLISYSIYLVQYLVLYPVVQTIFATPALAGIEARLAMGGFVAVATIILAATTYRFIEQPWARKPKSRRDAMRRGDKGVSLPAGSVAPAAAAGRASTFVYRSPEDRTPNQASRT